MTRHDLEAVVATVGRNAVVRQEGAAVDYFERLKNAARFTQDHTSIACAQCRYSMFEISREGLVLDFCLNCQAVWFDEGELQATLALARQRGPLGLIPSEVGENDTASLICYMLEATTGSG